MITDGDSLKCAYFNIFLYAVLSTTTCCSIVKISLYVEELLKVFIKYSNNYLIRFSFHLCGQNLSSKIIQYSVTREVSLISYKERIK